MTNTATLDKPETKQENPTVAEQPPSQLANPAPLGLFAFGMTTVLLNLHNSGIFPLDTMILSMGIFYGGVAQIIAGISEFKKKNTFGMTAFCSYGLFWLTLVFIFAAPELGLAVKPNATSLAFYLFIWGLLTGLMFIGTLKLNRGLQTVFLSLTILFILLGIHKLLGPEGAGHTVGLIAGIEGLFVGFSAIYVAIAEILNEVYGKVVLSIGPVEK